MNRKNEFVLGLVMFSFVLSSNGVSVGNCCSAYKQNVRFRDPDAINYTDDYRVDYYKKMHYIYDFSGKQHRKLGIVSKVADSLAYKECSKVIYDSWWNSQEENHHEDFISNQYNTYSFAKYIDLPVVIYHTRRVAPNSSVSFTIQTTQTSSTTKSHTVDIANTAYGEFSSSYGFNAGVKASIDQIGANGSTSFNYKTKVGGSISNTITNTKSETTTFSIVYTETFNFDNTNHNEYRYFQLNQRQKFKVYFTTNYVYNYTTRQWGSGLFNLDQNWTYSFEDYSGIETCFFLLPIETPYFEMSVYHDSSSGLKEYIDNSSSTIYYI